MSFNDLDARIERLGLMCMVVCPLVILLSGCGGSALPPEPVAITFAYWVSDTACVDAVVQEFSEQFPYITVDLRPSCMGDLAWNLRAEDADVREAFVTIILAATLPPFRGLCWRTDCSTPLVDSSTRRLKRWRY